MKYTCVLCGQEFEAKHKTALCKTCLNTPSVCVICGKEFPKRSPYNQKTCSAKCRGIYRKNSGIGKAIGQKMRETKLRKYGTLDPSDVSRLKNGGQLNSKICKLCGKSFVPETSWQQYCKDVHYGPCPVCGNLTEIKDYSVGPQACSEKCRMARINATCLERYGNKDAVNSDHAKKLARIHSLARYGVEYYSQTDEYKLRFKATSLEKYGTEHPMQNKDIVQKVKDTSRIRYGADSYMQSEIGKERVRAIFNEKYGGIGLAADKIREKAMATNRERYGSDWGFGSKEIRNKITKSIRARYAVDNYFSSRENMETRIVDPSKVDEYLAFKNDPKGYIESHYTDKPPIYVLTHDLGVSDTPIYDVLIRHNCKDVIDRTKVSTMEYEMHKYLEELIPSCDIIVNDRKAIKPNELDFYMSKYSFAIECNPTLSHNSTVNNWDSEGEIMPYNYHKIKSQKANDAGIFLMHVFGYEWEHKRDILKSMIANSLGKCKNKIYARNCYIDDVSYSETKLFLDQNHRQGNCSSKIRLGLFEENSNKIVSIMTFGNMRATMGKINSDDGAYELVRFCSLLNTNVVGGASKLFKHFLNKYNPDKVVSFSDVAHTRGNLYEKLGFKYVSLSDPGYVWVKPYGEVYRNRVSCQKHLLPSLFEDVDENTIKEKSERTIMIEHGYLQVYDSGVIRWEYSPNNV